MGTAYKVILIIIQKNMRLVLDIGQILFQCFLLKNYPLIALTRKIKPSLLQLQAYKKIIKYVLTSTLM